jgi:Methyltransferase domain
MPGVDLGLARGLALLEEVVPRHIESFRARFPLHQVAGEDFFLINGTYMAIDGHVYWSLIREYRPRRIIEIGAHASTMIATAAVASRQTEGAPICQITAIEPYPSDYLLREDGRSITLIKSKVQDISLELFTSLEAGDILFIDSTHMLRTGSDVQYEFLEILPRLSPGVLVHLHDISLPKHYPKVYFDNRIYWNEQYLLQAFLAFNNRFEVLWAGNGMMLAYPEQMQRTFREYADMRAVYPSSEPTAFWMRVAS